MRILALVTEAFGGSGGIARYNRDLLTALALASDAHSINVVPRLAAGGVDKLPERISQLPPVMGRLGYGIAGLHQVLRHGPYELIYCGHLYMLPLAAVLSRLSGAPVWLQAHGIEVWERPSRLIEAALRCVTLTTAVSRYTRSRMIGWSRLDPMRIRVLPNTFEPRFTPGPKPQGLVDRFDCRDHRVLLTVSRLSAKERYKGHDRIICVLPAIQQRHPGTIYVIAGDGDDRPRLEQLVKEVGVERTVFFTGHVDDGALLDYYRLADAFVMPSTGEGFGIVYLEAAAAGVPVIAGNRDGSVDALADGALGVLVDPDDQEALCAAISATFDRRGPSPSLHLRFGTENFRAHVSALVQAVHS